MLKKMLILTICLLAVKSVLTKPMAIESPENITTLIPDILSTTEELVSENSTEQMTNDIVTPTVIIADDHHEQENATEIDSTELPINSTKNVKKEIVKRAIVTVFDVEDTNVTLPNLKNATEEEKINDTEIEEIIVVEATTEEINDAEISTEEFNVSETITTEEDELSETSTKQDEFAETTTENFQNYVTYTDEIVTREY